jgi:hypothetical protein
MSKASPEIVQKKRERSVELEQVIQQLNEQLADLR